jgi:hypothetical protein
MPITVRWDDEARTIVRWVFEGKWTWDEYNQAMIESNQQVRGVEHPVDAIMDLTASNVLPTNVLSNTHAARDELQPKNIRWIYIVSHQALLKALINIFGRLYERFSKGGLSMLDSLDAAHADIKVRRAALDSSEKPAPAS